MQLHCNYIFSSSSLLSTSLKYVDSLLGNMSLLGRITTAFFTCHGSAFHLFHFSIFFPQLLMNNSVANDWFLRRVVLAFTGGGGLAGLPQASCLSHHHLQVPDEASNHLPIIELNVKLQTLQVRQNNKKGPVSLRNN